MGVVVGVAAGFGVAAVSKNAAPKDLQSAWDAFIQAQRNYMTLVKASKADGTYGEWLKTRGQMSEASGQSSVVSGQYSGNSPSTLNPQPSAHNPTVKEGTWIAFDENVADFGTVDQGAESVKIFTYRNKGNQRLVIENVTSTCGCTVGQPEPKELPPGGVGHVRVSFKSGAFSGPVRKSLTVQSNDPTLPRLTLGIKANVRTLFTLEPKVVDLGDVERGKTAIKEVIIKPVTQEPFALRQVTTTHQQLRAEPLPMEQSADGALHLRLSLDASQNYSAFTYAARLYFSRTSPGSATPGQSGMLELVIPVKGTVAGPLRVNPDSVFFGSVKAGERFKSQKLRLTSRTGQPVEVRGVDSTFAGLKAAVTPLKRGLEYEVELTDSAPPPTGFFQQTLHILTGDSKVPIEVKLSGVVMKAM